MAKIKEKNSAINNETKLFAFLAVFLTIIGFIISLIAKRDNYYVMFYAKQGLVLFILQIIAIVTKSLPLIGSIASNVIWVLFIILWIMAWLNALSGKTKDSWLIGEFAKKIKI